MELAGNGKQVLGGHVPDIHAGSSHGKAVVDDDRTNAESVRLSCRKGGSASSQDNQIVPFNGDPPFAPS